MKFTALLILITAAACVYDADRRCGPAMRFDVGLDACVCEDTAVVDGLGCKACAEDEIAVDGSCGRQECAERLRADLRPR
jgi:hypothetical protein